MVLEAIIFVDRMDDFSRKTWNIDKEKHGTHILPISCQWDYNHITHKLVIFKKLFFLGTHFFKLALKSYCQHAITKNSQKHIPKV